ncbi:MAG: TlpA family protein disulfide reductase [Rickettsiaceae bacterium]|nr:TlpA family protein disulfide reductase [Rickettsiaceae bacterium]
MLSTKKFLLLISLFIIFAAKLQVALALKTTISKPDELYAPDTAFFDENGNKIFLDQFEGKTIILVFWATWCGTCVDSMFSLDVLQKDFRKLPLEIIAVSEDFHGVEIVKKYFAENDIRHLKIYHDYQNKLFSASTASVLPTALILDPDGKVKAILKGPVKWHDSAIRNLILLEIPGNPETPKNSYKIPPLISQKTINTNSKVNKETTKNEEQNDEQTDKQNNKQANN